MRKLMGGQATAWAVVALAIITVIVGYVLPFQTAMGVIAAILVVVIILSLLAARALERATIGPVNGTLSTLSTGGFVLTMLGVTTALGWMASSDPAATLYLQFLAAYTVVVNITMAVAIRKAT